MGTADALCASNAQGYDLELRGFPLDSCGSDAVVDDSVRRLRGHQCSDLGSHAQFFGMCETLRCPSFSTIVRCERERCLNRRTTFVSTVHAYVARASRMLITFVNLHHRSMLVLR